MIVLEGLDQNRTIWLSLQRFYPVHPGATERRRHEVTMEFSAPGAGTLFFETGAFAEGAIAHHPSRRFWTELCLVHEPQRLRFVYLREPDGAEKRTLIRETRTGIEAPHRPALNLDAWVGTWQGQATIRTPAAPDSPTRSQTMAWAKPLADRSIQFQESGFSDSQEMTGIAQWDGTHLTRSQPASQTLFLPDGAWLTQPVPFPADQPFFLELGWQVQPNCRQRLRRTYDAAGRLQSAIWVTEHCEGDRLPATVAQ